MDTHASPAEMAGKLTGATRRSFIRGIAAAGASTAAAYALDRSGVASLFPESADAHGRSTFSEFNSIAASQADRFEVPAGFRADVLIAWGDKFADGRGNVLEYGFNNDFLAFFPLGHGRQDEGILFVNHEYASSFYQHGWRADAASVSQGKTAEQIEIERRSIGNSILHIKQDRRGVWKVVSPSRYNRRIYAGAVDAPQSAGSRFDVTGPLRGHALVGDEIDGTVGNCSGGITPWGTALSCEENFDGYGLKLAAGVDFASGWVEAGFDDYHPGAPYRTDGAGFAKYGWVCEHDPYDPRVKPRKHTALGRFRHENTAFRARRGSKFVLYMGDDKAGEGVYKFVSDRSYKPWDRRNNLKILESGTLYIAKWTPEGRRRFTTAGDTVPITATSGTGEWVEVPEEDLIDTATKLRARFGTAEYDTHYATNRPEDVEVEEDTHHVFVAFTNNSGVRDVHGAVRRIVEDGDDPEATTFTWDDFANGGETTRTAAGEKGFSCCDNLVFDKDGDLWVVTDISSGTLNKPGPLEYHANNALFYVPTSGPNAGVAFRFGNMPVESEGTGPYFTPDEQTLFVNVQHPGEVTGDPASTVPYGDVANYSSWWPAGDKSAGQNQSTPRPATVAISRPRRWKEGSNLLPRPVGYDEHDHGHHGGDDDHHGHGHGHGGRDDDHDRDRHSRRDFLRRG